MMFLNKLASRNNSDAATEFKLGKREFSSYLYPFYSHRIPNNSIHLQIKLSVFSSLEYRIKKIPNQVLYDRKVI